jgi:hypothetical protein
VRAKGEMHPAMYTVLEAANAAFLHIDQNGYCLVRFLEHRA